MSVHNAQKTRLAKLALYYHLKDSLSADSLDSMVSVREEYPDSVTGVNPPMIIMSVLPISFEGWELGGKNRLLFDVLLDIYAKNAGQRDDLSDIIQEYLDGAKITIGDYNQGFPPTVVPSIGRMRIRSIDISQPIITDRIGIFPDNIK